MIRFPQTDRPEDFAEYSRSLWASMDPFYAYWVPRWRRTLEYIRGEHWRALLDVQDGRDLPEWKRYPVVNFVGAFYVDFITQWMQSRVRWSALPDDATAGDISKAEIADHILAYLWDHLDMETVKLDLGAWLFATGNADARVFYNRDTGDLVPLAERSPEGALVPLDPGTLQPDPSRAQPALVDAGDLAVEVLSPQHVRWSPRRSEGVLIGFSLTRDEAERRYGPETAARMSYARAQEVGLSLDALSPVSPTRLTERVEQAFVIEHQIPRSSRFPRGLSWETSGTQLVREPHELPGRELGVVHWRWVPLVGHPYFGLSPLYDLTKTNKILDESLARTQEWADRVVPKRLIPSGTAIQEGVTLTDEPGQEVTVPAGTEIRYTQLPSPPPFFDRLREESRVDMRTLGGYAFARGLQLPPGESMQRLRQPPEMLNQGEPISLALINSRGAWAQLGQVLLGFAREYYDAPMIATIVGPDRTYQWREFTSEDIKDLRAHVRVAELPLYTWNRQSMRDAVIGLLNTNAGALLFAGPSGQLDREKLNAAMEAVGLDAPLASFDADVAEARNEVYMFANLLEGMDPPKRMPWQNSEVHLAEKLKTVKSMAFRGWPEFRRSALLQNLAEHEEALALAEQRRSRAMIEQESQLRQVRAQAESSQKVTTVLGQQLVELLTDLIRKTTIQTREGDDHDRSD